MSGGVESTSTLPVSIPRTMTEEDDRRCPYCDTDEEDLDEPLEDHVLDCQPIQLSLDP